MDPSAYMSPMDLYDSIFWGKLAHFFSLSLSLCMSIPLGELSLGQILTAWPGSESPDPFYTGTDMSFDFMAQPPPGQPPQQQFYF